MFRPFRLILLAGCALLVYLGFFATPGGSRSETAFNSDRLAAKEVALWQAARTQEEFSTYLSAVQMLREQQRYSWFRAAQAGYYLSGATMQFVKLTTRFERILPELEAAAAIERDWRGATFSPADVARAQLTWWVTLKVPNLSEGNDVSSLIAKEYALRYGISGGDLDESARFRAEAVRLRDSAQQDPDWPTITTLLTRSYKALKVGLQHATRKVPA